MSVHVIYYTVQYIQCIVYTTTLPTVQYKIGCTVYSVQYTVYSVHYYTTYYSTVQDWVHSVQCTLLHYLQYSTDWVHSVQCTIYSVQCTLLHYLLQYSTRLGEQCTVYNIQCTVYTTTLPTTVQYRLGAQCTVYNIHCTVYTTTLPTTVKYRLGAQCTVYWFRVSSSKLRVIGNTHHRVDVYFLHLAMHTYHNHSIMSR